MVKHVLLTLTVILLASTSRAQTPQSPISSSDYVTIWQGSQILIPAYGEYTLYYESIPAGISKILPESGTFTNSQAITFPTPGTYRVAIKPTGNIPFHRMRLRGSANAANLISIEQWGNTVWSSLESAYWGCSRLVAINATDAPILDKGISMKGAFKDCFLLASAPNINNWDVSNATDMSYMFNNAVVFNEPLDKWNVSAVKDMTWMFCYASAFNQPVDSWNVSKVTSMEAMFAGDSVFNQPLNSWNISKVINIANMFAGCIAFNQPLNNWNVSAVVNMHAVFAGAISFNQPIDKWDVSSAINMGLMFKSAIAFNQPIGNWDVSAATQLWGMFHSATAFNQPIGDWDVSGVEGFGEMFMDASAFNQPIGAWNTRLALDMSNMFNGASAFNQPIEDWNVSRVMTMNGLFVGAKAFNQSLGKWTLSPFNDRVTLASSGIDCSHYSSTLLGWARNPASPKDYLVLDVAGKTFGPDAAWARDTLKLAKGWTINGDYLDADCRVMPVTLVSFSARPISNQSVEVKWETAQEMQNDRFVVERSKDLVSFETVVEIRDVAGNSNALHTYRTVDKAPYAGTSYYRLVQYDLDGTFTTSRIVRAVIRAGEYGPYPNPSQNQYFRISLDEPVNALISLVDINGRAISFMHTPEGLQTVVIRPVQPLQQGTYVVTVDERGTRRSFNLIVQ